MQNLSRMRLFLIWLCIFIGILGITVVMKSASDTKTQSFANIVATITRHTPTNDAIVYFSYQYQGKLYEGLAKENTNTGAGAAIRQRFFNQYPVGSQVTIKIDPSNPSNYVFPNRIYQPFVLIMVGFFCAIVIGLILLTLTRNMKKTNEILQKKP